MPENDRKTEETDPRTKISLPPKRATTAREPNENPAKTAQLFRVPAGVPATSARPLAQTFVEAQTSLTKRNRRRERNLTSLETIAITKENITMNSTNNTMQATLETLAAMRHQEDTGYVKADFLRQRQQQVIDIDEDCRSKMCEWSYQVVKFCKFSRESVEIAMNYLDRFLLTPAGASALADRNIYQLASMTSLYSAIKVHERQAMNPQLVSMLSQGTYTPEQIEEMETTILAALQWRMNPPTILSFVRAYLELIPSDVISEAERKTAFEISVVQAETAVSDYKFIATPSSLIAYCTVVNSLESMGVDLKLLKYVEIMVGQAISIDCSMNNVTDVQRYLHTAIATSQPSFVPQQPTPNTPEKQHINRRASFGESPRSISASDLR